MAYRTEERQPLLGDHGNSIQRSNVTTSTSENRLAVNMRVRREVFESIRNLRFGTVQAVFSFAFNMPQIVAIVLILVQHSNERECDKPLSIWCACHGVRLLFSTMIAFVPMVTRVNVMTTAYQTLCDAVSLAGFCLFLVGNLFLLQPSNCAVDSPAIYQLALTLLVIQYIGLFLPCVLLVCMSPFFILCLPLFIRLAAALSPAADRGIDSDIICSLPVEQWKRGSMQPMECSICLAEFTTGSNMRVLNCGHRSFHAECVDSWLHINATCPICRAAVAGLRNGDIV